MKKIFLAICAMMFAFAAQAKDVEVKIPMEQLPEKAQTFVSENFANLVVKKTIQKFDDGVPEYKVYFKDNSVIEFDMTGAWNEIKASKKSSVSPDLLPMAVKNALESRYPGIAIVKVENDGYKYDIDLAGDIDVDIYANGVIKD